MPLPYESTHGRGNQNEETENLKSSTAWRLFKGKIQSPSPSETALEGTPVIAAVAGRAVELYGEKKEAGEEGEEYFYPGDVFLLL